MNILKTLLYYDIFSHPLKPDEVFSFLPQNSVSLDDIKQNLVTLAGSSESPVAEKDGYYYIKPAEDCVNSRVEKENYSLKMWKQAAMVTHIIKRFPFIRAVMISGSLSKNSSSRESDLDFMVITENDRLWISRTMLMLFKKIFLFNSYKYFCINYFVTISNLEIEDKNIFTATEIATIKATYNTGLLRKFIKQNHWVKKFFPNYILCDPALHTPGCKINNRKSFLQKIFELPFSGFAGSRLNRHLMNRTINHWLKKYPHLDETERNHMFRSTPDVSKTHPGNMQKKILGLYRDRLKKFNL